MVRNKEKIKIYTDCDDTITNSSEVIIDILNKRYNLHKSIDNLLDYNYQSIVKGISREEILSDYQSEVFWEKLRFFSKFMKVYQKEQDNYRWLVCSLGTKENLIQKRKFLYKNYPKMDLIDIKIVSTEYSEKKSKIDMRGAIQIDDKTEHLLCTNASIKILLTHGKDLNYNQAPSGIDNLYRVKNWDEIGSLLEHFGKYPEYVSRCYDEYSFETENEINIRRKIEKWKRNRSI